MTDTLQLKQHDTAPAFRARLQNLNDQKVLVPVDLTGASVRLIMKLQSSTTTVTGSMVVEDQTANLGWVHRNWLTGDTAINGYYEVEVEVTWGDSTVQTFPADGYAGVNIVADLG